MDNVQNRQVSRRKMIQSGGVLAALAGGIPALTLTNAQAAAQETWNRETDVVVVGTGAAGTPAAIEAARGGSQVIRLEKVEAVGGNLSHSQGIVYLGGGTALQQAHGFEDTPDQMFAYLSAFMAPWEDEEFIRFYVDNSVEHYNWFIENGVEFGTEYVPNKVITAGAGEGGLAFCGNEPNYPYNEITPPIPRGHSATGYGAGISAALQAVADAEPNITTEVNAPVVQLITDEAGRVIGVVAEIGGAREQILARQGVIIATGGYEFNEEMLKRTKMEQYQDLMIPQGSAYRGNTGDGLRMAGGIGARLRNMDQTFHTPFVYPPDARVHSVLVNKEGRRFANEASYGVVLGDEVVYHQDMIAWLIMNQSVADSVEAAGRPVSDYVAMADTLEELADLIDVPAASLVNEFAFYNEHAANGEDPVFHKPTEFITPLVEGPFYAFDFAANMPAMTAGHIEINIDTQVLDMEGEAIPGLYAAGQGGAGIGRKFYNSGVRLGEASFFGRVAGTTAAAADRWDGAAEIPADATPATESATSVAASEGQEFAIEDADIVIVATDIAFDQESVTIAADTDVLIGVVNEGVMPHDLAIEDTDFITEMVSPEATDVIVVNLPAGEYVGFCTVPGHRQAGMELTIVAE